MSNEEILLQLKRILASPQIVNSTVLAEFLSFIVTETIAGRGHELKEYTVGTSALHKEPDFNPQLDSIVRIHAGRLRRTLKEYYYEDGKNDQILIIVPKGSYTPVFTLRQGYSATPDDEVPAEIYQLSGTSNDGNTPEVNDPDTPDFPGSFVKKPILTVLPFSYLGHEKIKFFSKGLSEYLRTELTHFEEITVASRYTGSPSTYIKVQEAVTTLDADYVLGGSVQGDDDPARVFVHLTLAKSGQQIWANTFEKKDANQTSWEFQEEIVTLILATTTGINGTIVNHERITIQQLPHDMISTFPLTYWYYRYCNNFDRGTIKKAITFYEKIRQQNPYDPLVLAYLSELYSAEAYITVKMPGDALERASSLAQAALRIYPRSQQAHISLAITLLLLHQHRECIHIIERGFKVNAKSVDYQGAMGALIIYSGEFEKGIAFINGAMRLNPYLPWWHSFSQCLYCYYKEKYADAIFLCDRIEQDILTVRILKAAAYAELEDYDSARSTIENIRISYPAFNILNYDQINVVFVSNTLVNKIMSALEKTHSKAPEAFIPVRPS